MAALKGDNVTKIDLGTSGPNVLSQGLVNADVEVNTETFTFAAASIGDTVDIALPPTDGKIQMVEVFFAALGASTTLAVGDSDDVDRYIAATATDTAGSMRLTLTTAKGYVIGTNTGDDRIFLTLAGGAATGLIKVSVFFTR